MLKLQKKYPNVFWGTNENPYVIMDMFGSADDKKVLSICSGGTMPFGFLDRGGVVDAIDVSSSQIDYAKRRLNFLLEGNSNEFIQRVGIGLYRYNDKFMESVDCKNITKRVGYISFGLGDIFSLKDYDYDFVYLSNAGANGEDFFNRMNNLIDKLNCGSKVLFTSCVRSFEHLPRSIKEKVLDYRISDNLPFSELRWDYFLLEK